MKTKKQIDRLFRERFKDFEVSPPPQAWENISAALQEKKKDRKVIPLWYKAAGVAALFLAFFGLGNYFISNDMPSVTDIEVMPIENTIVDNQNKSADYKTSDIENTLVEEKNTFENVTKKQNKENSVAFEEKPSKENKSTSNKTATDFYIQDKEDKTPASDYAYIKTEKEAKENQTTDVVKYGIAETKEEKSFTELKQRNELFVTPKEIAEIEEGIVVKEENKKSLIEYLEERDKEAQIALAENDIQNRWMVSPNFAPVYYSSLGNGSSIDTQFSDSPKTGEVNYSYGVQVGYAINDKLSIRTGINKVEFGYTTNDIEFAAAPASAGLKSIDYGNATHIVAIGPKGTLPNYSGPVPTIDGELIVPRSGNIDGTMSQHLGYFEVPVELKYNLVNSRFGVNMVGGMSTLILNDNEISVTSFGFESVIGSATNLNSVSFSANLGVGLDYKISEKFIFNLEPMFKYQINTYSESNVDFRPYFLGVYSGFSFKF